MRCLSCFRDAIQVDTRHCPGCGVDLVHLLRDVLQPGSLLREGSYRVEHALGRGGFGITYLGVHVALDSVVAIKEYYPAAQAGRHSETRAVWVLPDQAEIFRQGLDRFYREGQLLAKLTHPNIVRVNDLFRERGTAYLVMEYLSGPTLRQVLDTNRAKKLPPERVEKLVGRLVDALGTLHARRIYHLDVSPENIVLQGEDRPVLIDFGAAKPEYRSSLSSRQFRTDYAPVELVAGEDVGTETDVFELGMVAHEMLTGNRPLPGLARLLGEPWEVGPLPGRWRALLVAALQVRRSDRPSDVREWWARHEIAGERLPAPVADSLTKAESELPHPPAAPLELREAPPSEHPLAKAVAALESGGSMHLPPGTHNLGRGLSLNQPITLTGDGMETTEVLVDAGDYVLRYEAEGRLTLRDLTFRWAGADVAHVAVIAEGQVDIERCRFSGAIGEGHEGGAGLALLGNVTGTVSSCRVDGNGSGILVGDRAAPLLEANFCQNNSLGGLTYLGEAAGGAVRNLCNANEQYGILVSDDARPTLEENTCHANRRSGIAYFGSAAGAARENNCSNNGRSGILVGDQGQPDLESNVCRGNPLSGIAYFGPAAGVARRNICSGSERYGIAIGEQARPLLESNTCQANQRSGIAYFGSSAGQARQNTCTGNDRYGISVAEDAQPELRGNTCRENRWSGLAYLGNGGGGASENECAANEHQGIMLSEDSHPLLEDNRCEQNGLSGISYRGRSGGQARLNQIRGNGQYGISVSELSQPELTGNTCHANRRSGIAYGGSASGSARENSCSSNEQHGVAIGDLARPTVESNVCTQNAWAGMSFRSGATGQAMRNTCSNNSQYGITIGDEARPELLENACETNQRSGVAYFGKAAGSAQRNACRSNGRYGISAGVESQPVLNGNECSGNSWSGIGYFGAAGGVAHHNVCDNNEQYGITVAEQSEPAISSNVCGGNGLSGLAFFGTATGSAQENHCVSNLRYGISIAEQSRPTLESNVCSDSGQDGICFQDQSGGVARANTCSGNRGSGIFVDAEANPMLVDNKCTGNRVRPITDRRR